MKLVLRSGLLRGSTVLSSPQGRVVAARRYRCAAFMVLATALAAAAQASTTTMTVDSARDNRTATEYTTTDFEVVDLNNLAEEGFVRVWDEVANWWEVRYTDPYPGDIPAGSELTSVVVTVQYLMEAATWDGTLTVNARTSVVSLGMTAMPEYTSATQETWDITSLVNAEADPLATLNDLSIRVINNDTSGPGINVVWSYTIVAVEFNAPPDQPSIQTPTPDAIDTSREPEITADAYSHVDAVTPPAHVSSDWEIYDDVGLAAENLAAFRNDDATNLTSIDMAVVGFTFQNSLSGKAALAPETEYWVRVQYKADNGLASAWSEPTHFTTGTGEPPSQPIITDPVSTATDVSRRPTVIADAFSDPEGDAHASSDWEIFADDLLTDRVASSMDDATNLETISVSVGGMFEGALAGKGNLAELTKYWVKVTYRDEYDEEATSAEVDFTTAANVVPDTPTITPLGAPASRNPTVTASAYNDPDYDAHASSDWEIFEDIGLSNLVASSMTDMTNLESIDVNSDNVTFEGALDGRGNLDPLTDYWVRVTYWDAYGAKATSVAVSFTTEANAAPDQVTITSPAVDETVVALNPVITTAPYGDPDGDPHDSTDWEIYDGADPLTANLVASSADDADNLTSIAIDETNAVFAGPLSGKTSLERATEYWVRARFTDDLGLDGDWPTPTHFETGDFPTTETWPFFGSGCSSSGGPSSASCCGLMLLVSFCAILLARTPLSRR